MALGTEAIAILLSLLSMGINMYTYCSYMYMYIIKLLLFQVQEYFMIVHFCYSVVTLH